MSTPTDAEFSAALEASTRDYQDRLAALESAIPVDMEIGVRIRAFILGFLGLRYDSRLRVHLKRLVRHNPGLLIEQESKIVKELHASPSAKIIRVQRHPHRPLSPAAVLLTGVGAAVGGAAVAMTAGLAAPIILPPIAAAIGSGVLAGSASMAAVATVAGAAGAGWSGYKVSRHFSDISGMLLRSVKLRNAPHSLGLNICVSGWYTDRAELPLHWSFMSLGETVVLEFEADLMESLGNWWEEMAMSTVAGLAVGEVLRATVLGTALAAIAWPLTLLQLGGMVDHPWWLGVGRARKVGRALARSLAEGSVQGVRPVCLYGVSMGAIVVQHCLEELARMGAFGIVEDVMILGLPAKLPSSLRLVRMRMVAAGRFVHGYSRNDWLLRFLFRTTRLHVGEVAGLIPWDVDGIESVDLTNLVANHTDYRTKLEEIMGLLNL